MPQPPMTAAPLPDIRPLTRGDAATLLDFYLTLSDDVTSSYQPFGAEVTEERIQGHLAEAEAGVTISLGLFADDGALAGHGFIRSLDSERPVLGIGLRTEAQGRGWGRALMEAALAAADGGGLPLVTLTVLKHNIRARSLYEKLGFVISGEASFRAADDSWRMERRIEAARKQEPS